ncbi:hypothetical protein AVEN_232605-1 [Araneus ventricosus]|uniref:Uncharacterized protein n=1 Tax=Araneus ventricosus TaxID=182803 RepID=A0A4Y2RSK4_ARAVE|nr:hypothetical protein AVEN_131320-1 [Araneus ventricosus]GBN78661.1 hypothetical protein AVEN_232605-1 [Araneus ventricosus]
MDEELQACNMQFLSISAIIVLSVLGLILGRKFLKVPEFTKILKMLPLPQHPVMINLNREVTELRRATQQIAKDWMEMKSMMTTMKDQQYSFIRRLDSDFVSMSDFLQNNVNVSLEEECLRNDQRFNKMHRMIEGFRDEFLGIKETIQKQGELMEQTRERQAAVVDGWSQTERDMIMKRRPREAPMKSSDDVGTDNEAARSIITVIKKALAEFLKEVKKHLAFQREEGMADMRVIFSQLSEDKEEIKCTIESAFSTATHQTQKSFEQFGLVGREAMKCMQALNEKSENCLTARFQEFGDKLIGVFELLKDLNFDVSSIKQILDNIDGQFDEIYQKLELSCQKNTEHCEEVTKKLKKTAEECSVKSFDLDQISKQLGNTTDGIKEMLCNLNNLICCKTADSMGMHVQQHPPNNLKVSSELSLFEEAILANQNISAFEQLSGPEGFSALVGMIHICFRKLNSLKDQIEQGTDGIRQSADILVEKLDFLMKLVEDSVENLKNLNVQETDGNHNLQHKSLNRDLKEFISNIINLDLNTKVDEEKLKSGNFPKLIGITEENTKPVLNPRYFNGIPKSPGFYLKRMDSDKTSIVTIVGNDAQERTPQTTA